MATRKLFLGNDWDVHRTGVASRGVLQSGLTVRGFLSATPNGDAIDPLLEVTLTELAAGDYIGTIQGYNLTGILGPLWDAANGKLTVYERVIVDDEDYSDAAPLVVTRDRVPTEPDDE